VVTGAGADAGWTAVTTVALVPWVVVTVIGAVAPELTTVEAGD
jgi:hypothetical protein